MSQGKLTKTAQKQKITAPLKFLQMSPSSPSSQSSDNSTQTTKLFNFNSSSENNIVKPTSYQANQGDSLLLEDSLLEEENLTEKMDQLNQFVTQKHAEYLQSENFSFVSEIKSSDLSKQSYEEQDKQESIPTQTMSDCFIIFSDRNHAQSPSILEYTSQKHFSNN